MSGYTGSSWVMITANGGVHGGRGGKYWGFGTGARYRMRGFDTNVAVNRVVYWGATLVDSTASQYTGSVGPVVDIVVASEG